MRIFIGYSSTGGNTKRTAELIADGAANAGAEPDLYNVYLLDASILLEYDAVLLGEPTYGDGDHHGDFIPFDAAMGKELQPGRLLQGIPAAAFAGCDRAYANFGRAVELIEDRLIECGAKILQRGLKIELSHTPESEVFTRQWGENFVRRCRSELPVQAHRPAMSRDEVDEVMGVSKEERDARNRM